MISPPTTVRIWSCRSERVPGRPATTRLSDTSVQGGRPRRARHQGPDQTCCLMQVPADRTRPARARRDCNACQTSVSISAGAREGACGATTHVDGVAGPFAGGNVSNQAQRSGNVPTVGSTPQRSRYQPNGRALDTATNGHRVACGGTDLVTTRFPGPESKTALTGSAACFLHVLWLRGLGYERDADCRTRTPILWS